MRQSINTIITHSGSFHADEIMALVLLKKFFFVLPYSMSIDDDIEQQKRWVKKEEETPIKNTWFQDGTQDCRQTVKIIRSREKKLLNLATQTKNTFVIDVGGSFNPKLLNFDHHQKSMTQTWKDGTPYSSTGLIWNFLKANHFLKELNNYEIKSLEDQIIKPLDKHDNGVEISQIALSISTFNRSSEDSAIQDYQFFKALDSLESVFDNTLYSIQMELKARKVLENRWHIAQKINSSVVLLTRPIEYKNCSNLLNEISNKKADILILPGQGNRFSIKSLPNEKQFSIKCPCPKEWRGKTDIKFNNGKRNILIKFCHKTGFMCVVEGTHKDAVAVANYIVNNNKLNIKHKDKKGFSRG